MRLLVDIEDADRAFVADMKESRGHVVILRAPDRAVRAVILGVAEPHSIAGTGHQYKALYDVTLLEGVDQVT